MSHGIPEIDIHEAKKKHEEGSAVFIDIRDPNSYAQAHIPGADNISDANIEAFIEETDKSRTVIVNCYMGNSSLGATQFLIEKGFAEVYSMKGGFEAWRAASFECDSAAPPASQVTPPPEPAPPVREPAPTPKKKGLFARIFGKD